MGFTFFFRDRQSLELVAKHSLPELKTKRNILIWDAGCAMGPEPYTLSIILRENMSHFLFRNLKIYASDIDENDQFGDIIKAGIYPIDQVKRIQPEILEKYFSPNNKEGYLKISEEIRKSVLFQKHDLLSLKPFRRGFGLVVCKNVLLHFKREERIKVIKMFYDVLDEGGFLLMEQTQKIPDPLKGLFKQVVSNAQLFRKLNVTS